MRKIKGLLFAENTFSAIVFPFDMMAIVVIVCMLMKRFIFGYFIWRTKFTAVAFSGFIPHKYRYVRILSHQNGNANEPAASSATVLEEENYGTAIRICLYFGRQACIQSFQRKRGRTFFGS